MPSAKAVYPDRSANSTVTWRRSSGGEDGADGATREPSSAAPQFMQKRASPGAGVPQVPHRRSSAVPQLMQKRAPAGFSVPHDAQLMELSLRHHPGVAVGLGDLRQKDPVHQRE